MKVPARRREIAKQVRLIRQPRGDHVHDRHGRGLDVLDVAGDDEQGGTEQGAASRHHGTAPIKTRRADGWRSISLALMWGRLFDAPAAPTNG